MCEGLSIEEIFEGYSTFQRCNQAPEIKHSKEHTVLFELPLSEDVDVLPIPRLNESEENESNFEEYVKLPFDKSSIYYEIDQNGEKIQKSRWDLIKDSLKNRKIENSKELEEAIKSYNTKFAKEWNFSALHKFFDEELLEEQQEQFFDELMPKIIDLALQLPDLIRSIPFLRQKRNQCISMSKKQAASILANAFLCTFPNRNVARKSTDYPEINFSRLFGSKSAHVVQKIKCIFNYFRRVILKMPTGVLTFQRRYIKDFPQWSTSDLKFSSIKWHSDSKGTIENAAGMLQVDFANRYLGGGVLGHGCVQEEIRFAVCPELIVGMLFFESMKPDETILITGAEIFNKHSGYSNTFKWEGNYIDNTPCDKFRRKQIYIVAMDAVSFHKPKMQFEEFLLRRETNKAYCGFYHDPNDIEKPIPVATGNWGCGAFRGAKNLKCLLQFIACVSNNRNLVYFTFGDEALMKSMAEMFSFLQQKDASISQLWKCLVTFKNDMKCFEDLYKYIYDNFDIINNNSPPETINECQSFNEIQSKKSDEDDYENPSKRSKISDDSSETSSIADLCANLNEKISAPENNENQICEQSSSNQPTILEYFKSNS
ncbi:hypothetical protein PVAND_010954 [Polypedilum vanderplanki]|uniref:poly(ADP-ribose) glycohydrolase n=1 Tax=Polypedilum vanderplanki TaxID=319348 RepID=A0A9J6CH41_POLVA|nr:hypothetical protein PVAND_010954 [Polypedilum vanderplanki]